MAKRNRLACDQCNSQKVKCVPLAHACARCQRLGFECAIKRRLNKRGRRAITTPATTRTLDQDDPCSPEYPVLRCLAFSDSADDELSTTHNTTRILMSKRMASKLLEHFYESPESALLAGVIRRCRLLDLRTPRKTEPLLLLSILCLSCYMPGPCHGFAPLGLSSARFIGLRRHLLSELMNRIEYITNPNAEPTFDSALTTLVVVTIGPTEEAIHSNLPYWLSFFKHVVKKLNLCYEPQDLTRDEREERRRLWWYAYIIDRHSALSLNLRPQFTDNECLNLPLPCPDDEWFSDNSLGEGQQLLSYGVSRLDVLGILIPLSRIVGEILEYHFLRQNNTFNLPELINGIRQNILQHLHIWLEYFQRHVPLDFCETPTAADAPVVAYYALHLYHCMYILLYGQMDLFTMYEDIEWQASSDFIEAGKHTFSCANIARFILLKDPELHFLHRLFGTYILQSSFIIMILAKKLQPDQVILDKCRSNLEILDVFVRSSNMKYQVDFARVLRRMLSRKPSNVSHLLDTDPMDPELRRYRWVAGWSGVWTSDLNSVDQGGRRGVTSSVHVLSDLVMSTAQGR